MRDLIEKYYSGSTSLAQEKKIRRYFAETALENMPEDIREHASLFMFFNVEVEKMGDINRRPILRRRNLYILSSMVAASLIIGVMMYFAAASSTMVGKEEVYLTVNGEKVYGNQAVKEFTQRHFEKVSNMMGRAENCFDSVGDMSDVVEKTFSKLNNREK